MPQNIEATAAAESKSVAATPEPPYERNPSIVECKLLPHVTAVSIETFRVLRPCLAAQNPVGVEAREIGAKTTRKFFFGAQNKSKKNTI